MRASPKIRGGTGACAPLSPAPFPRAGYGRAVVPAVSVSVAGNASGWRLPVGVSRNDSDGSVGLAGSSPRTYRAAAAPGSASAPRRRMTNYALRPTARHCGVGGGPKLAETARSSTRDRLHGPVPEHAPPHPANRLPAEAVACSVTSDPDSNVALQLPAAAPAVTAQSMPPGDDWTFPLCVPVPVTTTDRSGGSVGSSLPHDCSTDASASIGRAASTRVRDDGRTMRTIDVTFVIHDSLGENSGRDVRVSRGRGRGQYATRPANREPGGAHRPGSTHATDRAVARADGAPPDHLAARSSSPAGGAWTGGLLREATPPRSNRSTRARTAGP